MKKKDVIDLRNKTVPELDKLASDLQSQIVKAKMEMAMRKAKNTNLAENLGRTLKAILNLKREKEIYANT